MKLSFVVNSACITLMFTSGNAETPAAIFKTLHQIEFLSNDTNRQHRKEVSRSNREVLIIDNTISSTGQQFYNWFYSNWNTSEHNPCYFLTINEKVVSRQRSLLSVAIDEYVVSRFSLNTKDSDFEQIGSRQIESVHYFLMHPELIYNQIFEEY